MKWPDKIRYRIQTEMEGIVRRRGPLSVGDQVTDTLNCITVDDVLTVSPYASDLREKIMTYEKLLQKVIDAKHKTLDIIMSVEDEIEAALKND